MKIGVLGLSPSSTSLLSTMRGSSAFGGGTPPLAFSYPADLYSGMSFAFGFTKASSTYAGACMQVQRDSDGEYYEVGWLNNYYADLQSMLDWAGMDTVRVTKIYDSTGNGNDAVMGTQALQCRIATGGALTLYDKGLLYYWNGSRQQYVVINGTNTPINKSRLDAYLLYTRPPSNRSWAIGLHQNSINYGFLLLHQTSTALPYYDTRPPSYYKDGVAQSWPTRTTVRNSLTNGLMSQISIINASTNGSRIRVGNLRFGSTYDFYFDLHGTMQTHWGWTVDTSADQAAIEALINETYTYDPLNPFP